MEIVAAAAKKGVVYNILYIYYYNIKASFIVGKCPNSTQTFKMVSVILLVLRTGV